MPFQYLSNFHWKIKGIESKDEFNMLIQKQTLLGTKDLPPHTQNLYKSHKNENLIISFWRRLCNLKLHNVPANKHWVLISWNDYDMIYRVTQFQNAVLFMSEANVYIYILYLLKILGEMRKFHWRIILRVWYLVMSESSSITRISKIKRW